MFLESDQNLLNFSNKKYVLSFYTLCPRGAHPFVVGIGKKVLGRY